MAPKFRLLPLRLQKPLERPGPLYGLIACLKDQLDTAVRREAWRGPSEDVGKLGLEHLQSRVVLPPQSERGIGDSEPEGREVEHRAIVQQRCAVGEPGERRRRCEAQAVLGPSKLALTIGSASSSESMPNGSKGFDMPP